MAEESESEVKNDQITSSADPDEPSREETDMSLGLHLSPENTSSSIGIVHPKFNVKSKSSLKSILLDYGLPDDEVQRLQEESETKKKKKHRTRSFIENDEETGERRGKKESYLTVFNDTYKTPDYVVEDVMEKLTEKVDRQRKMIQRRSELLEKNRMEHEEQQRQKRLQKKKSRVDLHHNDSFMKQLPKSQFYKLVSIEDRLKAKGLLKHQIDIDDFWRSIRNPEVLERYTKSALTGPDIGQSEQEAQSSQPLSSASTSSIHSQPSRRSAANKENTHMDFRPMTQISEGGESSRPTTKEDIKTASSPYSLRKSPVKRRDPHSIARAAAQELEKKYPMVELPPMACFNMELGEQAPDPQQVLEEMQASRREKERLLYVKRIRKMYNLAQSHKAATHRILEKHGGEFDMLYEGENPITSMMPFVEEPQKTLPAISSHQQEADLLERRPWLRHIRSREVAPAEEQLDPQPKSAPKKKSSSKRKPVKRQESESERGSSSGSNKESTQPAPLRHEDLSINSLQEHSKVVESKALSTLWPNYLGGCKSVFAK